MMKKTSVTSRASLLLLLTCAGLTAAAAPATLSVPESEHRAESDSIYANQDKILKKAEALVQKGEYQEALELFKKVHAELALEIESKEGWIAKSRFREVAKRIQQVRRLYGTRQLKAAETAFSETRYNDTVTLADQAAKICPELKTEAARWRNAAIDQQRYDRRRADMSSDTANPMLSATEKEIARNLEAARTLMKNRRFEEARRRVEAVYKLNPFNAEASYLASQIYRHYYTMGFQRHQADIQGMFAYEAWQWVEPVFLRNQGINNVPDAKINTTGDQGINARLDQNRLDVKWTDAMFKTVIEALNRYQIDKDGNPVKDSDKVHIAFIDSSGAAPARQAARQRSNAIDDLSVDAPQQEEKSAAAPAAPSIDQLKISLEVNGSLREILDYVSFLTDIPYEVTNDRVCFGAANQVQRPQTFEITPDALGIIARFAGVDVSGGGGEEAAAAPEEPKKSSSKKSSSQSEGGGDSGDSEFGGEGTDLVEGSAAKIEIKQEDLKRFFETYGIDFKNPKSAISQTAGNRVRMINTAENLRKLGDVLRYINTPKPMVQIEVKSIEISEQDYEELGFDWSIGDLSSTEGSGRWSLSRGENTKQGGAVTMLRNALSGVNSNVLTNLNIFPDLFGSVKPFGSDQELNLSLTINALDRSDRTETIAAPAITVANEQTATAILGRSYYFPTDWDEMEIEVTGGDGDSGYSYTITRPNPDFDDSEDIGTIFTVKPTVKNDNYTINLAINPKITAFIKEESYYMTVSIYDKKEEEYLPDEVYRVWKPVISTRSIDANINVYDGETLVLGGLSDSNTQSRLDKVPILGDLPLIGRLFQSHSEVSDRKNMLIFVTARLVNDAGLPIRRLESTGGRPEVNY